MQWLTLSKTTSNLANKDSDKKTPLAMSSYPQLRALIIWIYFSHKSHFSIIPLPVNHWTTRIITPDMTVINLLSKDLLKCRKPA